MLQDRDKEITLVNVIERDDSLSHINALYEEVRFKDIQNKVFAEVKKDIDMLLQHKSDLLEKNGPSLTNSGTRQGLIDQIAILKGELEEKNRQISALLNIISSKSSTENPSRPLQDTVSPWKPEETSKHVAEFANCTPPAYRDFDTPKKNFLQTNNINGEVSQHSNGNSDVQLKNNLNIIISKKVRKLNLEKQLIDIRKTYHQNFVKRNSNTCATATNHKNNLETSAKENRINQIKSNSEKSSDKSHLRKKSNQSIKAHTWPKGSCLVIGDSMLEGLDERKMSSKRVVKVRKFPGATTDDMYHYLMLQKPPDNVILHVGTNYASLCNSSEIVNNILKLRSFISQKLPKTNIILSKPIMRSDTAAEKVNFGEVNKELNDFNFDMIDNSNLSRAHLNGRDLHLNTKGTL